MKINALAGKLATQDLLVDVPKLVTAYYSIIPDPLMSEQRVFFGTSGHRGSSFLKSYNEWHILAITQAICNYRKLHGITGPLFLGIDTHALSIPSFNSALEVLAANHVAVMLAEGNDFTPTPVISHAILSYNKKKSQGKADGIVITPSHNPPHEGGFKYNPPTGGPADLMVTNWIEEQANHFLENKLKGVERISIQKALGSPTTHFYPFRESYINDLDQIIDMEVIKNSKIHLGVDPLGGAGIHYWGQIAEKYGLDLEVVNKAIDPTFRFMTLDWDGQIRMDPSSIYAMNSLIAEKDHYRVAFACDTDHDRHGIVTPKAGLLSSNHYLCVAIAYLLKHRPKWKKTISIGKTVVSTSMIDYITRKLKHDLYEVPVGFKWFVEGLLERKLCMGCEESAGATFSRMDGSVWTTDKDGIVMALLSAEITARTGKDPGELYGDLTKEFGHFYEARVEALIQPAAKERLKNLSPRQISSDSLAGEKIDSILTQAPGNHAPIGGIKVITKNGWFAARPSGTEKIYKIYAESSLSEDHLKRIVDEAQMIVDKAIK